MNNRQSLYRKDMDYALDAHMTETALVDRAAAMAFFLMEHTGSIRGTWRGRMKKADQITLFGQFIGKGRIYIYGETEEVQMTVAKAFGTMREVEKSYRWAELARAA
jgi:hypothetical protein